MLKPDFFRAVLTLDVCGFLTGTHEIDRGVFVAGETVGWKAVARELAGNLPGQVRPSAGTGGVAWYNGADGPHGVIVDANVWEKIKAAREVAADLGALDRQRKVYSLGGVARSLLTFVGDKQVYEKTTENLMAQHPYGYHECEPGVYMSRGERYLPPTFSDDLFAEPIPQTDPTYKPGAVMYDVSSYYYQMFQRLPSLRVSIYPTPGGESRVKFWPMRHNEKARWKDVLDAIGENKPLRNSMAGVCAGTLKRGIAYTSARPNKALYPEEWAEWFPGMVRVIRPKGTPGPFRAAGLLLVATGAELCYREALTVNAIYATIDSVAMREGTPKVWPSFGFTARKHGEGIAEFCHRGSYMIGPRSTRVYTDLKHREYIPHERTEVPQVFAAQWL